MGSCPNLNCCLTVSEFGRGEISQIQQFEPRLDRASDDHRQNKVVRAMRIIGKIKSYGMSASSVMQPGTSVRCSTGHTLATDLPKAVGGHDAAPQPVELLVASLLGCKTATAHFVARHLFPRPHNRLSLVAFSDVVATRDERGALTLPITSAPEVTSAILSVQGVATVSLVSDSVAVTDADVQELGRIVEIRCPVAATLASAGVALEFDWRLARPPLAPTSEK